MSAPTVANVVARARVLWPALTESAAPDATAEAWATWALQIAGCAYGTERLDAAAHALAHAMYRLDPANELGTGGASTGALAGLSTGGLSVSYQTGGAGRMGSDADLETTRPGQMLLMLRATLSAHVPMVL